MKSSAKFIAVALSVQVIAFGCSNDEDSLGSDVGGASGTGGEVAKATGGAKQGVGGNATGGTKAIGGVSATATESSAISGTTSTGGMPGVGGSTSSPATTSAGGVIVTGGTFATGGTAGVAPASGNAGTSIGGAAGSAGVAATAGRPATATGGVAGAVAVSLAGASNSIAGTAGAAGTLATAGSAGIVGEAGASGSVATAGSAGVAGASQAVSTVFVAPIEAGESSNWTGPTNSSNPIVTLHEITSPYDGGTALQTTAYGDTYQACETQLTWRELVLPYAVASDKTALNLYLAFESDQTTYNWPGLELVYYNAGVFVGYNLYYSSSTIGSYLLDRTANWHDIGDNGYQQLKVEPFLDPENNVASSSIQFDSIKMYMINYTCIGNNSVTIDAVSVVALP